MSSAKIISSNPSKTKLNSKWILWFHSPDEKSWEIDSYKNIEEFDTIEDYYLTNWETNFHEYVRVIKQGFRINYYKFLGRSCLSKYFRGSYMESLKGSIKKGEIEYNVIFKLYEDDNFKIKGIIDRLDYITDKVHGKNQLEIHDYKTSSRLMSKKDADEKDRQLALYQIDNFYL